MPDFTYETSYECPNAMDSTFKRATCSYGGTMYGTEPPKIVGGLKTCPKCGLQLVAIKNAV